ncbi:secreted protein containing Fibronectin, type III domain protein [Candidatus Magnetomorum sp. HK-1]|nr:secreted protein containing Fibronectin, type III domain protein [Candidatus Magnetomorum sp. HK-1]
MKKIVLLLLFIWIIPVICNATISSGCTAYYSFNEDWIDGSPSDNTAVPLGNPLFIEGKKGKAIFLDGVDDSVTLGVNNFIDQLSISFWVKFPELPENWQTIISRYDETIINDTTLLKNSFYIKVLGKTNDHRIYFAVSENGQQSSDIISNISIISQTWYHIVASFQEGKIILYINGEKENEKQTPFQQLYTSAVPTLVGSMYRNGIESKPFANMTLDELRLYNRNLSEFEIQGLYEKKSGPKILDHAPKGMLRESISYVDILFDQPIISKLFSSDDILMTGPEYQVIAVDEPEQLSNSLYRLGFAEQSATGTYTIQLGPHIIDEAGNEMNQDQDDINGEPEDIYNAEFQLNVLPDTVLIINFSDHIHDDDSRHIYETLLEAGATVAYVNLMTEKHENILISLLTNTVNPYQQVWIIDASTQDGKFPSALTAISEWFLEKNDRHIIFDGRIRASYWIDQWETKGQLLTDNYYENLKINGGGLLLATDHPDYHPDINSICDQINISRFGNFAGYKTVQTDNSCYLMSYPNELGNFLGTTSRSSMVPYGKQPNERHLFCVAWNPDNSAKCSISTTLTPLIPTNFSSKIINNNIELTWSPAKPENKVSHYNIYVNDQAFSSISSLTPYQTNIFNTNAQITSLQAGKTYYMAVTAVDLSGKERQDVFSISTKFGSPKRSSGGDGGGGCFLDLIWDINSID